MINGYSEEIPLMQYVNDWNLYIKKKSLLLDFFYITAVSFRMRKQLLLLI